jgi:hypothetical protein
MAERNRVLPDGSIVAVSARGAWMGNRGCLHEDHSIVRPWQLRAWLVCQLSFRGHRVAQWAPRRYTPLFFYDEAVALAAGHRPCGECRRHAYLVYRDTAGAATAGELDARLHAERQSGPARALWRDLPDGAFILSPDGPALVLEDRIVGWDNEAYAYGAAAPRPRSGSTHVLTPPTTLDVLRSGVPVQVDDTARRASVDRVRKTSNS